MANDELYVIICLVTGFPQNSLSRTVSELSYFILPLFCLGAQANNHLVLFIAKAFTFHHSMPKTLAFLMIVHLHLHLGREVWRLPCRFQSRECFSISPTGLLRVWLNSIFAHWSPHLCCRILSTYVVLRSCWCLVKVP